MSPEDFLTWHEISLLPQGTRLRLLKEPNPVVLAGCFLDFAQDFTDFYFDTDYGFRLRSQVPNHAYAERSDFYNPTRTAAPACECGALKCGHSGHSLWCPLHK